MNNGNNENGNSSNANAELTEEQKKALAEQEAADKKAAESTDVNEVKEHNKKLFERTKKAEEEAKEAKRKLREIEEEKNKGNGSGNANINNNNNNADRKLSDDEIVLLARGMSDEDIQQAKVIAKGTGTNLVKALEHPMFKAYQSKKEEDEKKEKAKLGPSSGSGQSAPKSEFKGGMSEADHKEAWRKRMRGE